MFTKKKQHFHFQFLRPPLKQIVRVVVGVVAAVEDLKDLFFVSVVVFLSALICDINFYMVNIENNSYKNVNVIHERKTADKIEFSSLPSQILLNDTRIRYQYCRLWLWLKNCPLKTIFFNDPMSITKQLDKDL
uniref:Uncharacterized protein n=1 Tax=Glossina austeni TaxID=7395 RepID=A0A1A9VA98_GLOAU